MNRHGNILISVLLGVLFASLLGITTDEILRNVYQSSNQSLKVTLTASPPGSVTSTGTAPNLAVFTTATNIGSYAGTGTCGAGTFVTALSAAGVATCGTPSGGAPTTATYITQTADAGLSAEQAIGALSSGILRGANTTGVITSLGDVLPVANGGTGLASGTSGGIPGYTASGVLASSAALGVGQVVLGGGAGAVPTATAAFSQIGGAALVDSGVNAVSSFCAQDGSVNAFCVIDNASTVVNGLRVQGGASGAGPILSTAANNAPIVLTPNGTGNVRFPDGSAASPAISFTSAATYGLGISGSTIEVWHAGVLTADWSPSELRLRNATPKITLGPNGASPALLGEADNIIQMGADASTAVAQTLHGPDSTGSTITGGAFTVAAGAGTIGIANGGLLSMKGGAPNSTGVRGLAAVQHLAGLGTAPGSLTGCGSGAAIAGNDVAGRVTAGTAPGATCAFTFNEPYAAAPACSCTDETTVGLCTATTTTTGVTMTGTFILADKVVYHCIAY